MTARRQHESLRSSYTAKDTKDLTRLISADLTGTSTAPRSKAGRASAVVFVFTGQGSVYTGMCSQLFHTCRRFQEMILSYQMICDSLGFPGVVEMIQRSKLDVEPRTTTVKSQLALVIVEIALARLWISWGLRPSLLIGHSLGEFAALCVSGVLSVSDTLYLVGKRSTMMQETCSPHTHTMLAVGGTMEDVAQLLAIRHRDCQVSCINAPANVVVSGPNEELKGLQIEAQARGMSAVFLNVQYGFHSSQMDSILPGFEACARGVHFSKPKIPIASTLTGTIVEDGGTFCPTYLRQQAREPVRFTDALKACVATGADDPRIWMEIGPEPICLGLIRANLHVASMTLLPTIKSTEDNWKTITTSISTAYEFMVSLGWLEYHREYIDALTLLELPTYAFDLKKYWSSYSPKPLPRRDNIPTETCTPAVRPNLSTCLQQVVKESFEDEQISVTFISHTSDPMLLKAIQGHLVAGTALCPASAFCDMAYTAAKYIHNKENPGKAIPDMSIRALNLTHPVTLHSSNSEIVVEISATMYRADNSSVHISFASRQGSSTMSNGSCEIKFESSYHWQPQFLRTLHLVHSRMRTLVDSSMAGRGHRLLRPIVYKLFADLVEYDDKYQSIQQVFVDENYVDAAADIVPTSKSDTGVFTYNPYWIDALMHLAGFILNAHVTKSKDIVYLATGFDSLRVIDALSEEKRYRSYVSVQDGDKSIVVADVHVFEGDKLVAYCAGLEFRSMTRTVLKTLLGTGAPDGYIPHSQLGTTITESGHAGSDIRGARRETMGEASRATHKPRHASVSNAPVSRLSKPVPSSTSLGPYEEFSDKADALLALVASEAGLKSEDLEPSTRFSNLGVDSLMSIAIVSAANHRLSLELSASFFIDCPTVSDVQVQLGKRRNREHGSAQQTSTSEQELSPLQTPSEASMHSPRTETDVGYSESEPGSLESNAKSTELGHVTNDSIKPTGRIKREANVVLMQGRPSSTETPLFLIADGAGSATSYIHIPRLPRHNRIYAIESPFLHSPQDYTISVQEISHIFLSAVLKTQPEGPYIIGGWSAGAVYAYEVSRLLLTQGETVLGLILIDMHVPKPMPQDIEASVEFIEEAGIDTGLKRSCHPSSAPSYDLKQHLVSTVRALMHFKPTPMEPACRPNHTFLIWARRGLNETAGDGLPRFKKEKTPASSSLAREGKSGAADATGLGFEAWFYGERSDFGPKGWEDLVGDVECHVMEADHFSMVVPPHVRYFHPLPSPALCKLYYLGF